MNQNSRICLFSFTVQFYLNGTGVSPFNLTIDNQIALHWNVSDPRKSIPVYAENVR